LEPAAVKWQKMPLYDRIIVIIEIIFSIFNKHQQQRHVPQEPEALSVCAA
jgi:uncharacterized membrane protein